MTNNELDKISHKASDFKLFEPVAGRTFRYQSGPRRTWKTFITYSRPMVTDDRKGK